MGPLHEPCPRTLQVPVVQGEVLQAALELMYGLGGDVPLHGLTHIGQEDEAEELQLLFGRWWGPS